MKKWFMFVVLVALSVSAVAQQSITIGPAVVVVYDDVIVLDYSWQREAYVSGDDITLFVQAVGLDLTYQWSDDLGPIDGGTGDTLLVSPGELLVGTHTYSCEISSSCGGPEVVEVITVNIYENLSGYIDPTDLELCVAGGGELQAIVSGGKAPYTYQWMKDGAPIPDAISDVLALVDVTLDDAGSYYCDVDDTPLEDLDHSDL